MIEKDIVDRVPTHAGRVKLTPVSGQTNIFDMERADNPTVEGTPIDKATLDGISKNRLTGRFYIPSVTSAKNGVVGITTETGTSALTAYANELSIAENIAPLDWNEGQRITIQMPEITSSNAITKNTLNGISVNTILQSARRYELVYNGSSFDVKEV